MTGFIVRPCIDRLVIEQVDFIVGHRTMFAVMAESMLSNGLDSFFMIGIRLLRRAIPVELIDAHNG